MTYNLEDLIEKWEDSIKSECFPTYDSQEHSFRKIFNFNNVEFIVNNDSLSDLNNHSNELENSSYILKTKKIKQFLSVKYRTFLSFFDILINYN